MGKIVPNILNPNFTTKKPFKKLTTDVTEFSIVSGKIYLSPIKGLFNGEIISYSVSRRLVYAQVDEMLSKAFKKIPNNSSALILQIKAGSIRWDINKRHLKKKG